MNFGMDTTECWAESLNGFWQMRWLACFMCIWNRRSQKDLRGSYPSHVHALLFVKPDPGHAIGEELAAFVGTGTLQAPGTTAYPFISFHRLHLQRETCTLESGKHSNCQ